MNKTSQFVTRSEHDESKEAKRVLMTDPFGGLVTEGNFTLAFAYDGNGDLLYLGRAQIGTATSEAAWQIRKLTYSAGDLTGITWAQATDAFTNEWDERANYSYS